MSSYLNELNETQRAAVEQLEGPVMIIAGAGSGKTRVLTYRITHLINSGIDPFNILALTFTNKAAREMKARIAKLSGGEARNLWMGTYHSVFARVLRVEAEKLGFPSNFTIYDTDDAKSLVRTILKEQGLDDKIYKPSVVLNRISNAKNNLRNWQDYQEDIEQVNHDTQTGKPKIGQIFEQYSKRCLKASAMDFDDLIYNMYVLLMRYPEALYKYQNKFKFIMVDEFQDTNFAQYTVVKKLAAKLENICVVGDDAQSIYAFRGANIQNILNFEKDYPDLHTFKLEQNYRSTKVIVQAANEVIANNKKQLQKTVWTDNDDGDKIKVLRANSDNEEGKLIANQIFNDKMNHQCAHSDFTILYRTNAQSRALEEALRKMNLPYRIYGGISFYARKEIKDLLAYFRLTINSNDEEAFKRVINFPKRSIGGTSIDKMIVAADNYDCSLWDVVEHIHDYCRDISASTRAAIQDFGAMIKSFSVMAKTKNAYEIASHIATHSGILKEFYADRTPEGVSHFENLQELLNAIKEFTDTGVTGVPAPEIDAEIENPNEVQNAEPVLRTLDMFMQDIALLTDADKDGDKDVNKDTISLMTVHASKGLEFKTVFVAGLEEGLFPSQMSVEDREDLEEERRLFYVAITRAETRLYLSYALSRYKWGNLQMCEPSRFIEEIPQSNLSYLAAPRNEQRIQPPSQDSWNAIGKSQFRLKPSSTLPSNFKKVNSATKNPAFNDDLRLLQNGMEVEHERFGKGKVISMEGEYPETKCMVFFHGTGQKQLLLKYAKLKIVS